MNKTRDDTMKRSPHRQKNPEMKSTCSVPSRLALMAVCGSGVAVIPQCAEDCADLREEQAMRRQYEKPVLRRATGIDFVLSIISERWQRLCRQCSSCHGCR